MEIDWLITLDYIGKNLAFEDSFALELALQPWLASTPMSIVCINLKKYITMCKEMELENTQQSQIYGRNLTSGTASLLPYGLESYVYGQYGRNSTAGTTSLLNILACLEYQTKTGAQVAFMTEDVYKLCVFSDCMAHLYVFASNENPLVLQILINFESKFRECIALNVLSLMGNNINGPTDVYIYLLGLAEFRAAGLRELSTDVYPFFGMKQTDELNVGLFFDPAELQKYFTGEKFKLLDLSDVNEVLMNLKILANFIGIQSTNPMIL
jgi:hypothetical protein